MGHDTALTLEEHRKIGALFLAGWNLTGVSKVVKCSRRAVRNYLSKNGTSQSQRVSFFGKPKVMPSFTQLIHSKVTKGNISTRQLCNELNLDMYRKTIPSVLGKYQKFGYCKAGHTPILTINYKTISDHKFNHMEWVKKHVRLSGNSGLK